MKSSAESPLAAVSGGREVSGNTLRDVVALSTLPAIWTGADPPRIAESLAASLFTMLDSRFVYVSFALAGFPVRVAVAQTGRYETDPSMAGQIGPAVLDWARTHDPDDLLPLELTAGPGLVRVATRQIGLNADLGVIAAAFPPEYQLTPTDLLLLNVAATQAAIAVQNAALLQSLKASELRATRAAEEISQREALFSNLAEAIPAVCFMAHGGGDLFWCNPRWYEYTGTTPEHTMGWNWTNALDPEILPDVLERWNACIRTGENFEMVLPLRRADGIFRPFLTRIVPVRDERGHITRWFGTSTDITAQKETERELRTANADLEQFAYSASHDLQEPLRTVKIFSQLVAAKSKDKLDAQSLDYLNNVISGATRMEALVRDLLMYAQTTLVEAAGESADATTSVSAALTNLKMTIDETGAVVRFETLPVVPVPHTELNLLFHNLIGNAIKYRRPGVTPTVHISAKESNAHWIFSVTDNGIGIEEKYRERIFGLFKRLHTSEQYSGTGIGLALCRRIVARHNGRIWVESKPGEGSTFCFTLPA